MPPAVALQRVASQLGLPFLTTREQPETNRDTIEKQLSEKSDNRPTVDLDDSIHVMGRVAPHSSTLALSILTSLAEDTAPRHANPTVFACHDAICGQRWQTKSWKLLLNCLDLKSLPLQTTATRKISTAPQRRRREANLKTAQSHPSRSHCSRFA